LIEFLGEDREYCLFNKIKPFFPMQSPLCLSPRYRLDDETPWLEGIDPSRHYWIHVNGDTRLTTSIPGLVATSFEEFKATLLKFRDLQPGDDLVLQRAVGDCTIQCISLNCFAIVGEVNQAEVLHLFDREALESLLMTAHPDWICSQKDLELGRRSLMRSWQQPAVA
jgi:hypothetical protein